MLSLIINLSRFIFILLMFLFILFGWRSYKRLPSQKQAAPYAHSQQVIIALFIILADTIIMLHTIEAEGDMKECLIWLGAEAGGMLLMGVLCETLHQGTSRLVWNCIFFLLAISIAVLWRLKTAIAIKQIQWMLICFVFVNVVVLVMRGRWIYKIPVWLFIAASIGFIALPFVFPYYSGGAVNWANIGGFIFQPSEIVKITFIFMIGYIYSRKTSLKGLIVSSGTTAFLALALLLQKDLGGVLVFGIVFWFMTYEYLNRKLWLWLGLIIAVVGLFVAYKLFGHVRVRVNSWLDPWSDISGGSYQIAHSLFAIVGGGWFGTGLYQGVPTYIPVNTTDMIFSAIAEEFGVIFCILLILIYTFLFMTMVEYARHEGEAHKRSLLLGIAVLFMSQTFVIIGGAIKLIPLTGVTLPLLSYGGTSMLSMFALFGIVQGIIRSSYPPIRKEVTDNAGQQNPPYPAGEPYPYGQRPYTGGADPSYRQPGQDPYVTQGDAQSQDGTIKTPFQF